MKANTDRRRGGMKSRFHGFILLVRNIVKKSEIKIMPDDEQVLETQRSLVSHQRPYGWKLKLRRLIGTEACQLWTSVAQYDVSTPFYRPTLSARVCIVVHILTHIGQRDAGLSRIGLICIALGCLAAKFGIISE